MDLERGYVSLSSTVAMIVTFLLGMFPDNPRPRDRLAFGIGAQID